MYKSLVKSSFRLDVEILKNNAEAATGTHVKQIYKILCLYKFFVVMADVNYTRYNIAQ